MITRLSEILQRRPWRYRVSPFPHFTARDVFVPLFYEAIASEFQRIKDLGLDESADPTRFSRNMPNSDAYAWNFPPEIDGPLAMFYSLEWHHLLCRLTMADCTMDVNGALHHHQLHSQNGSVHRDLAIAWFSRQVRPDGMNPMDLSRCSYSRGSIRDSSIDVYESVRAVTMIFYLANPPWKSGDGGETGLYSSASDPVDCPAIAIPPENNSLLVFENTPASYHSFISNKRTTRNSLILWLHRTKQSTLARWPTERVYLW